MAAIVQMTFWNVFFLKEKSGIFIRIRLKFVYGFPIDYRSALVQVMTWQL